MEPISLETTIDAPRERVFDAICDLSRRPAWTDHFTEDYRLESVDGNGEGAGARFRVGAPGGVSYVDTTISEADRPHRIVEQGYGGHQNRVHVKAVWELAEGAGVTDVTLVFWTEPKAMFDRLREAGRAGRWWRRRWSRALRRLRDVVESGPQDAHPVGVAGGRRQPTGVA
jgi:uncharacterized protein YndB with AHSA1/START domain